MWSSYVFGSYIWFFSEIVGIEKQGALMPLFSGKNKNMRKVYINVKKSSNRITPVISSIFVLKKRL